ncbi:Muramoyltetrapeptide carboxypeptidase [Alkalibacterium sp. AK22]|uniref:S66 family peptidase n=1 Tax=Alkalibacterium sp. AK22 TaxID=1229520 RepID=UPI0004504314|nr:S66 peptidase family protein [Alkalibacterium sp. AK22]EXJ24370.1 Muramoyltetrapeptide carboxypeptidase [Alkalibacterium sp. AK22]
MKKPKGLEKGDKVAVVSLSSGILGEAFAEHQLKLGSDRLTELGLIPVFMPHALKGMDALDKHPEWRAEDLKEAFRDSSIKGIICAIGGDDTYRLLPYLMEDDEFIENVQTSPKLFTGFSDTTVNHLMFYRLGMTSFYGPNFLNDFAELGSELLPYTKTIIKGFFAGHELKGVPASDTWYEERTDFSKEALGTERVQYVEERGAEVLQGKSSVTGKLLGGCLESLVECLTGERYKEQAEMIQTYTIFPSLDEWTDTLLFIETSEERPTPDKFREMLTVLKNYGLFEVINGILVGKPQNEVHYEEYKSILVEIVEDKTLPILYNLPFGHAYPRCLLPYGIETTLDTENKSLTFNESYFN